MSAVTRRAKAFGAFVYDFAIGDDWRIALGVALALAATWGLHRKGVVVWWLLPVVVAVVLASSLISAAGADARAHAEAGATEPPG